MGDITRRYLVALVIFVLLSSGTLMVAYAQDEYAMSGRIDTSGCIPDPDELAPRLLGGARASSLVIEDVVLLSQPRYTTDTLPLEIIEIPAGAYVVVYDIDEETENWFRIVFPCDGINMTGWVPVSTVRFPARRANPKPAPPGCAQALEVVELLNGEWRSNSQGRIAVVADLFRATGGERFPRSFYYLTRNGREIRDKERAFETSGPFLIRAVVLGTDVVPGNRIGFSVITASREELEFFGILYYVPEGCEFGE